MVWVIMAGIKVRGEICVVFVAGVLSTDVAQFLNVQTANYQASMKFYVLL